MGAAVRPPVWSTQKIFGRLRQAEGVGGGGGTFVRGGKRLPISVFFFFFVLARRCVNEALVEETKLSAAYGKHRTPQQRSKQHRPGACQKGMVGKSVCA